MVLISCKQREEAAKNKRIVILGGPFRLLWRNKSHRDVPPTSLCGVVRLELHNALGLRVPRMDRE